MKKAASRAALMENAGMENFNYSDWLWVKLIGLVVVVAAWNFWKGLTGRK